MNTFRASLALAVLLMSCATARPTLRLNVESFSDPSAPVPLGATFDLVETGLSGNDLLEKELLHLVRQRLEGRGFRYDSASPQYLVAVVGRMSSAEEYIPPRTAYIPIPGSVTSTTTGYGQVGSIPVSGTSTTTTQGTNYVPITSGGYSVTNYRRVIEVLVAKAEDRTQEGKLIPVWSGRVDSTGSTGDLLLVAPPLLDNLLGEFPRRSGRLPDRIIEWAPPGATR